MKKNRVGRKNNNKVLICSKNSWQLPAKKNAVPEAQKYQQRNFKLAVWLKKKLIFTKKRAGAVTWGTVCVCLCGWGWSGDNDAEVFGNTVSRHESLYF